MYNPEYKGKQICTDGTEIREAEVTICDSVPEIQELKLFEQLDHPAAITARLVIEERVIIGLDCELVEFACIDIPIQEFDHINPDYLAA